MFLVLSKCNEQLVDLLFFTSMNTETRSKLEDDLSLYRNTYVSRNLNFIVTDLKTRWTNTYLIYWTLDTQK